MLQQKPEKRPEMEQVLVQMVEIKVEQRLKSMSIRYALDVVTAQKNGIQDQNEILQVQNAIFQDQYSILQGQNATYRVELYKVTAQKNDLQDHNSSLKDELTAQKN